VILKKPSLLVRLLTRYFKLVGVPSSVVPAGFERIANSDCGITVVAQSDSAVIEALLAAIGDVRGVTFSKVIAGAPLNGRLNWCSLHDQQALAHALSGDPEQHFVTINLFHVRGPVRNNPSYRMGIKRLWRVFIGGRFLFIIFGQDFDFESSTAQDGNVKRLQRALKLDFYQNLKLIRGTPFQSLDAQARAILGGTEFEREVRLAAQRSIGRRAPGSSGEDTRIDESLLRKTRIAAEREFRIIAANPRRIMYGLLSPVVNLLLRQLFTSVVTQGLDRIIPAVREHAVVIVPMHRSHLDYILVGAQLYNANLNPPLVAAGINLSFWPAGPLARSLGAYFVRRDARHDRVHAMVLRRYVTYLAKRGHLQEFFIEGGRSRTGRMRQPKVGLLNILHEAWTKRERQDILFVPVSITYENVVEEKSFGDENTGESKAKENLVSLVKARSIFGKKYGEVVLKFGNPISLSGFVAERGSVEVATGVRDSRPVVQQLGLTLSRRIRDQSSISLSGLVYSALLMAPRYGLAREKLLTCTRQLAELAMIMRETNSEVGAPTQSLARFLDGHDLLIDDMAGSGVVQSGRTLSSVVFSIPGRRRFTADFYKNSVLHVFFVPALLAISELMTGSIDLDIVLRLRDTFEYDFLLSDPDAFRREAELVCVALQRHNVVKMSDQGLRFSSHDSGYFIPSMLLSTLQAYVWTYENLFSYPPGDLVSVNQDFARLPVFSYSKFLDRLQYSFKNATYMGFMTRTEAASRNSLITVLESLQQRKLISIQETKGKRDTITVLKDWSDERNLLRNAIAVIED